MATAQERAALLAVACPWCHAAPGEVCELRLRRPVPAQRSRLRVVRPPTPTTLDAGCHDARWQAALGVSAQVRVPARS